MAELNGTKLEKIPITFQLADKLIDGAVVKPLSFMGYTDCVTEAQGMAQPKNFDARIKRLRLVKQVSYFVNGTETPITVNDIPKLAIASARSLIVKLDEGEGKAGKIIRDGDGIEKAITYELGNPISTGAGKPPITELEFIAKTYGDVEDVMSAPDGIHQTAALLANVAKPIGSSLMTLPSWAISLISIADGVTIARDILPRFLGLPPE